MLFLLVLNYQLIKIANNDCYLPNYSQKFDTKELINLQISCPKNQIQEINLVDYPNVKLISIYDESNVVISCFQSTDDAQQIYFNFYGKPTISFNNSCHFSNFKIYESPIFNLMQNSSFLVDFLFLYNNEYQFPFPFKNIYYPKNEVDKENRAIRYINIYNMTCHEQLKFILNYNFFKIECDYNDPIKIYYQYMYNHTFQYTPYIIDIEYYIVSYSYIPGILKLIMDSIANTTLSEKIINFINFGDDTNFSSYIDVFPVNTKFFATLSDKYSIWCQNRAVSNADELEPLFDFGWKPLCIFGMPKIHYTLTNKTYEMEFISKKAYRTLVAVVVVAVIIFLASIVLIVFCRYHSYKKKQKSQ